MNANRLFWLSIALMLITNLQSEAQPNITQAEYFFDADPGFGNASQLSISGGIDISNMNASINVNSLSNGLHQLFVRAKSSAGWSLTNKWQFLKTSVTGNIQRAEYFFNSDPGFGNGTPLAITPSGNISNLLANIDIPALQTGIVVLYIRTQDATGNWSLTNAWHFFYEPRLGLVDKVEYFYDADPGFGNGIPVAINSTNLLQDYLVPVNVTGLATGDHSIYWRAHSARGWSLTNIDTFTITTASPAPFINVNSITQKVNCAWASFRMSFHATGTYNAGNHFMVQLSDKDGSFASPFVIADTATTLSSEVTCVLPSHLPEGNNYRIRVVSTNAALTGIADIDALTVHDRPDLGADTTAYIVCQGETYNLLPLYNTSGFTTVNWSTPAPTVAPAGIYQLIVSNVYGCLDTANATVQQDVAVWTGAISKNWHVAGNWSNSHIPSEKTHVIIDGAATNPCEITDKDGTAASVQMRSGGNIKLLNGRKLLVAATCNPLPLAP